MSTWAVIRTGGKQYKVAEGDKLAVEKIQPDKKGNVVFSEVLLVKNDNSLTLGKPLVEKAKVVAKVLGDFRGEKIRVVKFKSKSRYLRTRGHRQGKTRILIEKIQV